MNEVAKSRAVEPLTSGERIVRSARKERRRGLLRARRLVAGSWWERIGNMIPWCILASVVILGITQMGGASSSIDRITAPVMYAQVSAARAESPEFRTWLSVQRERPELDHIRIQSAVDLAEALVDEHPELPKQLVAQAQGFGGALIEVYFDPDIDLQSCVELRDAFRRDVTLNFLGDNFDEFKAASHEGPKNGWRDWISVALLIGLCMILALWIARAQVVRRSVSFFVLAQLGVPHWQIRYFVLRSAIESACGGVAFACILAATWSMEFESQAAAMHSTQAWIEGYGLQCLLAAAVACACAALGARTHLERWTHWGVDNDTK